MKRVDISAAAKKMLDVPFVHQGRDRSRGVDCVGLIVCALEELGIPYVDLKGYGRTPHAGKLMATIDSQPNMRKVPVPVSGGVLLFRIKRDPQHVAVFDGENLIHSYSTIGRVVVQPFDEFWASRIVACYEVLA